MSLLSGEKNKTTGATIKEHVSSRRDIMTGITFKMLKIVVDRKTAIRKRHPEARRTREEIISIEFTITTSNFNSEILRPNGQSSIVLKYIKSRYQRGKLIRTIIV